MGLGDFFSGKDAPEIILSMCDKALSAHEGDKKARKELVNTGVQDIYNLLRQPPSLEKLIDTLQFQYLRNTEKSISDVVLNWIEINRGRIEKCLAENKKNPPLKL